MTPRQRWKEAFGKYREQHGLIPYDDYAQDYDILEVNGVVMKVYEEAERFEIQRDTTPDATVERRCFHDRLNVVIRYAQSPYGIHSALLSFINDLKTANRESQRLGFKLP